MAKDKNETLEEKREEILNPADRDARGDTPSQAAARVAGAEKGEEFLGDAEPANEREAILASRAQARKEAVEVPAARRGQAKAYRLFHPAGFGVTVLGDARRDELISRGYTTEKPATAEAVEERRGARARR